MRLSSICSIGIPLIHMAAALPLGPGHRLLAVEQVVHALDVRAVHAARGIVCTARVEEKQAARVLPGIQQAVGLRVDEDAAARVAGADQVRVRIPDIARLEAVPRRAHQLMLGEPPRQAGVAGIPESLFGPEPPGGDSAGPE